MITGFENETQPLTAFEEKFLLPMFVKTLSKKVGKYNLVTASKISEGTNNYLKGVDTVSGKIKVDGPRVRKIINHIRMNNLVPGLIATSSGYYVTRDPDELQKYINSLTERENAIRAVRLKITEYLMTISSTQKQ